jgi:hypothetical protein
MALNTCAVLPIYSSAQFIGGNLVSGFSRFGDFLNAVNNGLWQASNRVPVAETYCPCAIEQEPAVAFANFNVPATN